MTFETSEQTTLNEPERVCADALAELFLGETGRPDAARREGGQRGESPAEDRAGRPDPAPAAPTPATARRVLQEGLTDDAIAVEVVLAGHLPVMASAWVSQYARGVAAAGQPVGLIRAAGGRLSVEVFGDDAARPRQAPATAMDAVRQLRAQTDRWVIQADGESAGELIDRGQADRLTLLCSADEAALVAGYRMVKDLLEPRVELAAPLGPLHIAIAGRADPEAMAAAERLSRAAERFLGIETTVAVGAARIEAGSSASWFEGEAPAPGELAQLAAALGEGGGEAGAADMARSIGADRAASDGGEFRHAVGAWAPAIAGPGFFSVVAGSNGSSRSTSPAAATGDLEPAAGVEPGPDADLDPHPEPRPSLQPMDDRPPVAPAAPFALQCPRAPGIAFRVEAGRLVAIAEASAGGVDAAVRQLMIAAAWAAEHDALIAQLTGRSGAGAERVLLVEDAASARSLLDADIRVRVVAAGRHEIPLN